RDARTKRDERQRLRLALAPQLQRMVAALPEWSGFWRLAPIADRAERIAYSIHLRGRCVAVEVSMFRGGAMRGAERAAPWRARRRCDPARARERVLRFHRGIEWQHVRDLIARCDET